jgi:PEP-CTERM motif
VPPFAGDRAFQMEVSGTAAPEPSTWAMMLLGFVGFRRRPTGNLA